MSSILITHDLKEFPITGNVYSPESFFLRMNENSITKDPHDLAYSKSEYHDNCFFSGGIREIIVTHYGYFWVTKKEMSRTFFENYDLALEDFLKFNENK